MVSYLLFSYDDVGPMITGVLMPATYSHSCVHFHIGFLFHSEDLYALGIIWLHDFLTTHLLP